MQIAQGSSVEAGQAAAIGSGLDELRAEERDLKRKLDELRQEKTVVHTLAVQDMAGREEELEVQLAVSERGRLRLHDDLKRFRQLLASARAAAEENSRDAAIFKSKCDDLLNSQSAEKGAMQQLEASLAAVKVKLEESQEELEELKASTSRENHGLEGPALAEHTRRIVVKIAAKFIWRRAAALWRKQVLWKSWRLLQNDSMQRRISSARDEIQRRGIDHGLVLLGSCFARRQKVSLRRSLKVWRAHASRNAAQKHRLLQIMLKLRNRQSRRALWKWKDESIGQSWHLQRMQHHQGLSILEKIASNVVHQQTNRAFRKWTMCANAWSSRKTRCEFAFRLCEERIVRSRQQSLRRAVNKFQEKHGSAKKDIPKGNKNRRLSFIYSTSRREVRGVACQLSTWHDDARAHKHSNAHLHLLFSNLVRRWRFSNLSASFRRMQNIVHAKKRTSLQRNSRQFQSTERLMGMLSRWQLKVYSRAWRKWIAFCDTYTAERRACSRFMVMLVRYRENQALAKWKTVAKEQKAASQRDESVRSMLHRIVVQAHQHSWTRVSPVARIFARRFGLVEMKREAKRATAMETMEATFRKNEERMEATIRI